MEKSNFGVQLLLARKERGLSQKQLAYMLHTDQSVISRWERGRDTPTQSSLRKLAGILERPLSYFVDGSSATYGASSPDGNSVRLPILAEIPAHYPAYPESDVDGIVELPRSIVKGAKYIIACDRDDGDISLQAGDYCLVRPETEIVDGKIMVADTPEGLRIKRLFKKEGSGEPHTDGRRQQTLKPGEIKVLGQVVKIIRNP